MSKGGWTLTGTEFDGQGGFRAKNDSGPSVYETARLTKVSHNTPNMWRKVTEIVAFKPRSGRTPTPPRRPFLRLPFRPILLDRKPKQSAASWRRALARYELKLAMYNAKVVRLTLAYEARLRKYESRLAKYEIFFQKLRNGVPRKVRKRNRIMQNIEWHPFSQTLTMDTGTRGTWTTNWRQWFYGSPISGAWQYSGDITGVVDIVANGRWPNDGLTDLISQATTAADSIALNRFHDKLTGEQVHLGQVIAERAQTINLLAQSADRLIAFLRAFTPKKILASTLRKFSKKGLRETADDYLAFKFGAEPLMSDVKGAAEAVAHMMVDKLDTFSVKVTGSANKHATISGSVGNLVYTHDVSVNVRYVCEYGLDNMLTREMSKLGLINPAEILWELTPWSFVVDWLYPVGGYLRHLTNGAGLIYQRGTQSTKTTVVTTVRVVKHEADPNTPQYWGSEEWNSFDWTRSRGTKTKVRTLINESPAVMLPSFKNPFSATHIAEGIALLYQSAKFK